MRSISAFVKRYELDRAARCSMRGWKDQGWLMNVPLYAAGRVADALADA